MTINDLYIQLFGKVAIQDGNVIDMAEHGRVGGLSTGQGVKYVQILDNSGDIIDAFGAQATVTAIQGLGGTNPWLITMATHTVIAVGNVASGGSDSDNPVKVGGRYNSTQPTFTDGQRGDVQLGQRGSVRVELWGSDSNTAITRRPDNNDGAAPSSTSHNLAVHSRNSVFNGTNWDRMTGSTLGLLVTCATLPVVAGQVGTWTVQPGNTPNTTAWLMTMATHPVISHQGLAGSSPWLMTMATQSVIAHQGGTWAIASLPTLSMVGNQYMGKLLPSDVDINGSNANHADKYYTNAGAVTDGIIWSPAAGKRWHVLTLYINVSAAATVTIEDDLAGGDVARWKGELAANSGVVLTYDSEHPFSSGEDAADLIITTSAGNVYVQAVGYEV